jgi:hypothetical protein
MLARCPRCDRHVRIADAVCPFCALERVTVALSIGAAMVACNAGDAPRELQSKIGSSVPEPPVPATSTPDRRAAVYGGPPSSPDRAQELLKSLEALNQALGLDAGSADASAPKKSK